MVEDLRGKESNDNQPHEVGDFVSMAEESLQSGASEHFHGDEGPYVIATTERNGGVCIVTQKDYAEFVVNPEIADFHDNVLNNGFPYMLISPKLLKIELKKNKP